MIEPVPAAGEDPVLFDAVLHPNRSLSPRGFGILMACLGGVSLVLGSAFLMIGAWPVFGLLGLDVLLVWLAFRINYGRARLHERVRLTERALTVQRIDHRGHGRTWQFQPHWLRVSMDDPPEHDSQVLLSSHGRHLVVGSFLSPEERLDFARALRAALDRMRSPLLT
ncbi:DUF2244 domain-containing protein [Arenibaculum pallidiluteum]|uniref:DUF2244 domain-containing protein n=1 Tax=Arenibaculum pallidiluteum TaxID=2812559 RepID=UPI001A96A9F1|nr:DUF2244 domain-containing protein [Arenibaculum pallidiluteum]